TRLRDTCGSTVVASGADKKAPCIFVKQRANVERAFCRLSNSVEERGQRTRGNHVSGLLSEGDGSVVCEEKSRGTRRDAFVDIVMVVVVRVEGANDAQRLCSGRPCEGRHHQKRCERTPS